MTDHFDTAAAFIDFEHVLNESGLRAALAHLLHRTDYRFIGIFRFQGGKANAAVHYDREQPDQLRATEVPDAATLCCFVRDTHGVFTTANAMREIGRAHV